MVLSAELELVVNQLYFWRAIVEGDLAVRLPIPHYCPGFSFVFWCLADSSTFLQSKNFQGGKLLLGGASGKMVCAKERIGSSHRLSQENSDDRNIEPLCQVSLSHTHTLTCTHYHYIQRYIYIYVHIFWHIPGWFSKVVVWQSQTEFEVNFFLYIWVMININQ